VVQEAAAPRPPVPAPPPAPPPPPGPPPTPACSYSISPGDASIAAGGGSGAITVTASSGCAWSATASASWLAITGAASGTGNGTVGYRVENNTGGPRSGTIRIADDTFTVTQAAASCSFTITPSSYTAAVGGGTVDVTVTLATGTSCAWTAASSSDWITVASVRNGSSGGSATLAIAANPGGER